MKKVNEKQKRITADELPHVRIADADFPAPFRSGLEYSSPARGTWNIVHTGMLIPEAHEIFVCAAGCLRGVVLTAAEMGAQDRFSTVAVRENNLLATSRAQTSTSYTGPCANASRILISPTAT